MVKYNAAVMGVIFYIMLLHKHYSHVNLQNLQDCVNLTRSLPDDHFKKWFAIGYDYKG